MTDYTAPAASSTGSAPVSKTKWIVQLVVGGVIVLPNIVTLILAILGLTKVDTDLETANKYYKWGWSGRAIGVGAWIGATARAAQPRMHGRPGPPGPGLPSCSGRAPRQGQSCLDSRRSSDHSTWKVPSASTRW